MAFLDPEDEQLGTDISLLDTLAPVWGIAVGKVALAQRIARALRLPRGAIPYFPNRGLYVPGYLQQKFGAGDAPRLASEISVECEKDPCVQNADVDTVFRFETRSLDIRIALDTAEGPFDLVLRATEVTVEILEIDGVTATTVTAEQALDLSGVNLIIFKGEKGDKGDTGAAGAGGGGAEAVLDFGSEELSSVAGTEEVAFEREVRFGDLGASLTAAISASLKVDTGTGTYRVRVGGTSGAADGTVALTITTNGTSYTITTSSAPFTNPTGTIPVKVTVQSAGAGQEAWIKNVVVTFR